MRGKDGFAGETVLGSRVALNYPDRKGEKRQNDNDQSSRQARPFHKCTEKPSAFALLLKPLETPARVWQAR
jgi:hypothetical protein